MKSLRVLSLVAALSLFGVAQQATQVAAPIAAQVVVPRLIRFSGQVKDASGTVGITFTLHKAQQDENALWIETQNVQLDSTGKYTVLLGVTKPEGIPTDLFSSGEAQWLGIQIQGKTEQPRVLLVSVPYALRAAEADTLAGHAAAEFVTTDKLSSAVQQQMQAASAPTTGTTVHKDSANGKSPTLDAATNFTDTTTNQVVLVTQNGTGAGLIATAGNNFALSATSTNTAIIGSSNGATHATAAALEGVTTASQGRGIFGWANTTTGVNFGLYGQANSVSGTGIAAASTATTGTTVGLEAQDNSPAGTAAVIQARGGGKIISGQSGASNTEVFSVDGSGNVHVNGTAKFGGLVTFAAGQTFSGSGEISAITAGTDLTGGGNTGNVTLNLDTTLVPQLNFSNTFTTGQIIEGPSLITGTNTSGSMLSVGNTGDAFSTAISASNGGQYGVGISASASSDGYGVEGFGTQSAGSIGVLGALSNSNGFSNSFFLLLDDDGLDSGIWADGADGQESALIATADDLDAGIFFNDSSASSTILVLNNFSGGPTGNGARDINNGAPAANAAPGFGTVVRAEGPGGVCGINQTGSIACTGQVKTLAATQNGTRQVETYSVQSAENWLEDYGSGQLSHGGVTIKLDPTFADTVNTGVDFHVFLTPGGDCKGLYVTNKTANSFEVHELGGGTTSIAFDYKIVAKRRGHETERLVDVTDRMQLEATAAHFRRLPESLPRKKMMYGAPTASPVKAGNVSTTQSVRPQAVRNTTTVPRRPETATP